ncbi:MAG: DUF493 domain-containing protein [Gammaproteobacteria bacterium]|nr:DUF493 domain-containing protein [Gammaproteobacteria bacterium]
MTDTEETLLEFPCDFPIKAFGKQNDDFDVFVVELVRRHVPDLGEGAVTTNTSTKGKYLCVTVTIHATSKAQIDAIYKELTDDKRVVMAL